MKFLFITTTRSKRGQASIWYEVPQEPKCFLVGQLHIHNPRVEGFHDQSDIFVLGCSCSLSAGITVDAFFDTWDIFGLLGLLGLLGIFLDILRFSIFCDDYLRVCSTTSRRLLALDDRLDCTCRLTVKNRSAGGRY